MQGREIPLLRVQA